MHSLFSLIVSRNVEDFPFQELTEYRHTLAVGWRSSEDSIWEQFAHAISALPTDCTLHWDEDLQVSRFMHGASSIDIRPGDGVSAQHSMMMALQSVFGHVYSIRLLNNFDCGSDAYFVVETHSAWEELEVENAHVRWFFTPIELLPDTFESPVTLIEEMGKRYADEV